MSITVIGSVAFDDVVTDHGTMHDAPGGSALFFTAAASLFAPVNLVGVVGDDFPNEEIAFLKSRGVDTTGLDIIQGGKTFRWGGEYATDMNIRSTTNLELNVFQSFNPVLNEKQANADFVFLGNIDPDLQLNVANQVTSAKFIGADTIECYIQDKPDKLKQVLGKVDLILINDEEARLVTGEQNVIIAAQALLKFGPKYAIVKKGEHGSILVGPDGMFIVPAFPVTSLVDPTGAGDSYAGGLFGYLASKDRIDQETIRQAVVYGGLVASFTVEDFSIKRLKELTLQDIEERFKYFRTATTY